MWPSAWPHCAILWVVFVSCLSQSDNESVTGRPVNDYIDANHKDALAETDFDLVSGEDISKCSDGRDGSGNFPAIPTNRPIIQPTNQPYKKPTNQQTNRRT